MESKVSNKSKKIILVRQGECVPIRRTAEAHLRLIMGSHDTTVALKKEPDEYKAFLKLN
jgi:hypothetical protein